MKGYISSKAKNERRREKSHRHHPFHLIVCVLAWFRNIRQPNHRVTTTIILMKLSYSSLIFWYVCILLCHNKDEYQQCGSRKSNHFCSRLLAIRFHSLAPCLSTLVMEIKQLQKRRFCRIISFPYKILKPEATKKRRKNARGKLYSCAPYFCSTLIFDFFYQPNYSLLVHWKLSKLYQWIFGVWRNDCIYSHWSHFCPLIREYQNVIYMHPTSIVWWLLYVLHVRNIKPKIVANNCWTPKDSHSQSRLSCMYNHNV